MSRTLYILRQLPNHIAPSIFHVNDANMDIVFIEHAASITPSSMKGAVVADKGMMVDDSLQVLTYDDLIEKIFLSEHIIVI
jgi:hypothetical protein